MTLIPNHLCRWSGLWLAALLSLLSTLHAQASMVTAIVIDGDLREDWPDQAIVAFRRPDTVGALTVKFTLTGTATQNVDYAASASTSLIIPNGEREAWLNFSPIADALNEPTETIIVTLQPDAAYSLSNLVAQKAVTVTLANASSKPGPKAAARFLMQAAFGPDADSPADADIIPQNVQGLMAQGFEGWINDQVLRPIGFQKPYIDYAVKAKKDVSKVASWWNRVMGVPSLYPGGKAQIADPLRQRMAFALSEILVISDKADALSNLDAGMTSYYDMLLTRSFGNFGDLLFDVAMHPCMGLYLSHLGNVKANPDEGTYPDENFAREIMQLFSIGLWELKVDGTRKLDPVSHEPIPTYNADTIRTFARVFTGLDYAKPLDKNGQNVTAPMRLIDDEHDLDAKVLLKGVTLPARTASNPDTGAAARLDIRGATDCLFNHPSCPPFICKQLIQRFITSNPSPAYVERVAGKFIDNGKGVRGDLKAVIKAILLDTEARDPAMLSDANFGKMREPYLRTVNLLRAFNAKAPNGLYEMNYLGDDYLYQQPYSAPSVFNFFKPGYSPPGPVSDAGLVAPEFQIVNALSALSGPNYYHDSIFYELFNQYYGVPSSGFVRLQLAPELALARDVPALMRRLDLVLTGGTLPAEQHQIVREAVEEMPAATSDDRLERVKMAIYLITSAPEFAILR